MYLDIANLANVCIYVHTKILIYPKMSGDKTYIHGMIILSTITLFTLVDYV